MSAVFSQVDPKLRSDLEWCQHERPARWIVRDPVTANFYSLSELERTAALLMNGSNSVREILSQVSAQYPLAQIDLSWIAALIGRFRINHLLLNDSFSEGRRLFLEGQSRRTKGLQQKLMSPLAIRVPLGDPSSLLSYLRLPAAILFHPLAVSIGLLAAVGMLLLVMGKLLDGTVAMPLALAAIQGDRWLILFLCYVGAKSMHELGHALACVHRRAACTEVGLMFLCLTPCFYCDTTDSWKLPSKWQRAGIAVAGIYVELIVAMLAALVWLLTKDGTLHYVAASLMVVCSIGTLLINFNPLLKYDGYYILSDLWGVPNLSEQGREAAGQLLRFVMTGTRPVHSGLDAGVIPLALYAFCSAVYRLFVLSLILWAIWHFLVPAGLGFLSLAITAVLLIGLVVGQIRMGRAFIRGLWRDSRAGMLGPVVSLSLIALTVAGLLTVPLPSRFRARATTDFREKTPVFASQVAELVYVAPTGIPIEAGKRLIGLKSLESELELVAIRGEISAVEKEVEQLQLRHTLDPLAGYLLPVKKEKLDALRAREQVMEQEVASLEISAPQCGFLMEAKNAAPTAFTAPPDERFANNLLDQKNLGCTVARGTLLGWFSPKRDVTLTAIVGEEQVKLLRLEMQALVQWDSDLSSVFSGRVTRIAPSRIATTPTELVGDPMLISTRNEQGEFVPEVPHFEVTIEMDGAAKPPAILHPRGATATIRFETEPRTAAQRVVDYLKKNLKPIY